MQRAQHSTSAIWGLAHKGAYSYYTHSDRSVPYPDLVQVCCAGRARTSIFCPCGPHVAQACNQLPQGPCIACFAWLAWCMVKLCIGTGRCDTLHLMDKRQALSVSLSIRCSVT